VATSLSAKGAIADRHPLSVGVVGTYSRACANRAVAEADLVFFVGTHAGGQITAMWKVPAPGTRVVQLDIDPEQLGRNYVNAVSLNGDAKTRLSMLIDAAGGTAPQRGRAWTDRVQQLVAEWRAAAEPMRNSDAVPLRPERICRELTEALPENGVVVSDTGHAGMWSGQMIDIDKPRQRYIRCEGSLGWGLPGAMGVKCALPDRPVALFTGDGGLYYHLPELETAARHRINLVVVANNNSSLNQEIPLVKAAYREKRDGLADEMWRFSKDASIAKVAEALGCKGVRVETPAQLREELPKAFALGRPVVLDCISDDQALAPTAWTPGGRQSAY
jgi:acetolactate synthase-1/2/3 large subunit